jgi:hypothetical protein
MYESRLYNLIIYYFDAYFNLFQTKDSPIIPFYMKLLTNNIEPPTFIQMTLLSWHVQEK